MGRRKIELLAPARNLDTGVAAIDHGADSVYIGGPKFGARASATNSLGDIEQLVAYAHLFGARVYVAINTIFDDHELKEAVTLCHKLHDTGVDALIIQDVGLLECDLPPIPLHSSTQMNNRTASKARFLEEVGFSQIVLARELSLDQIKEVRGATTVPLEFFVHGALCVSYSGQCYMSEVMAGRSANRGECAQFCRHSFNVIDGKNNIIEKNRYLLSLKDLDLSGHLEALVTAGVDSFKIEGRLKGENYVKNVTAFYRQALDRIIDDDETLQRSSSGTILPGFVPDTAKSFNRGKTDYFLRQKNQKNSPASILTPKSIGQPLGRVDYVEKRSFTLQSKERVENGDGLCFFDHQEHLQGIKVNRVENGRIYPREPVTLVPGTMVYRNSDVAFNKSVTRSSGCRKIGLRLELLEGKEGLQLEVVDEDNISSTTSIAVEKIVARKKGTTELLAVKQLKRAGGTVFSVDDVRVTIGEDLYVPSAILNELRRTGFARHQAARLNHYQAERRAIQPNDCPWPGGEITYLDNIANKKAKAFYLRHGVADINNSLKAGDVENCALMTTRYCIKAQMHSCPKMQGKTRKLVEPLRLVDNSGEYLLEFDCKMCEMTVRKRPDRE